MRRYISQIKCLIPTRVHREGARRKECRDRIAPVLFWKKHLHFDHWRERLSYFTLGRQGQVAETFASTSSFWNQTYDLPATCAAIREACAPRWKPAHPRIGEYATKFFERRLFDKLLIATHKELTCEPAIGFMKFWDNFGCTQYICQFFSGLYILSY